MSTHNIYFRGEIRKILCGYPLLSVAMQVVVSEWQRVIRLLHCLCLHCFLTLSTLG